ncbi:hypothetical protein Tco_1340947 [Tanacetum coccineum]
MDTLSLVSEYLKDLGECKDDGDLKVVKEAKLFDALEHKSVVIEVDNQKNCNLYQGTTSSLIEEVRSSSEEIVKMGKANRNKDYNINKLTPPPSLKVEEIPQTFVNPPQPIYHPLTQKQKEKMKEVLDIKYKELEESKPILEVLENYVVYKKKLNEI